MLVDGVVGDQLALETTNNQPSKDFGTVYQNTTTKIILLIISGDIFLPAQNDAISVQLLVDSVDPPTPIAWQEDYVNANLANIGQGFTVIGVILPNQFYKLVKENKVGTGDASVGIWNETTL